MQPRGSLNETDLRALLESAQSERATGTLTVREGGGRSATFYFLFGHLFHALSDGKTGDDAVVGALGWGAGEFDFDPKAKLPADETVRSSIPDLVHHAGNNRPAPEAAAPPPAAGNPISAPEAPTAPPAGPPAMQAPESAAPASPAERSGPADWGQPAIPAEPARGAEPTNNAEPMRGVEPVRSEEPARREEPGTPAPPQPRRGVKHRPQSKHGGDPIPVPAGVLIYDSLKTSFVDFPRLVTTLEREGYTGYVKLLTEDANGLIFFRDGSALECILDTGAEAPMLGTPALRAFHDEVTHGHGVLDVVSLNGDLVDGLHDLTVATPIYSDLYASWVDASALLRFLSDRNLSGSLMVRSAAGTGVVILSGGRLAGSYTTDAKEVADSADAVLALCADQAAVIEVKANEGRSRERLDVDSVIGANRSLEAEPATPAPGPVPSPAAAPVAAAPQPQPVAAAPATPAPPPAAVAATLPPSPNPAPAPPMNSAPAMATPAPPPPVAWEPAPASAAAPAPPVAGGAEATQNLPVQLPSPAGNSTMPTPIPAIPTPPPAVQAQPEPSPPAEVAPPPAAPLRVAPNWDAVIADLQATTEEALGNRSRKVKDVLASADRSQAGVETAINQIPTISILFVDSSRLEALAADLRAKLNSYLN